MPFGLLALAVLAMGCGLATTQDDAGSDAPRTGFHACSLDEDCVASEYCKTSLCGPTGAARGYCVDRSHEAVYCVSGRGCDDASLYCLDDSRCAFDSSGVCLTPAELADVCAHQPTHWACPSGDAGVVMQDAWRRSDGGGRADAGAPTSPCDLSGPSVVASYELPGLFAAELVQAGAVGDHWTVMGYCNDHGVAGAVPSMTWIAYVPLDGSPVESIAASGAEQVIAFVHGRFVLWDASFPDRLGQMDEDRRTNALSAPGWSPSGQRFVEGDQMWILASEGAGYRLTNALTGEMRRSPGASNVRAFDPAHGGIAEITGFDASSAVLSVREADGAPRGASLPFACMAGTRIEMVPTRSGLALALTDFTAGADRDHAVAHTRLRFFDSAGRDVGVETVLDDAVVTDVVLGSFPAPTLAPGPGDDVLVAWLSTTPSATRDLSQLRMVSIAPDGRRGREADLPIADGQVFRDGDAVLVLTSTYGASDSCDTTRAWVGTCR